MSPQDKRATYAALGHVIGGLALLFVVVFTTVKMVQAGSGWLAGLLVLAICWREWIHAGFRAEMDHLRKQIATRNDSD